MIPILAASLLLQGQAAAILPVPTKPAISDDVLAWPGFKYLGTGKRGTRDGLPVPADWSRIKGDVAPDAAVWRTKIVILERVDRAHEKGPEIVWPGHYGMLPPVIARIKRALPQLRALVADATRGAVDMRFDVSEETEVISLDGGDLQTVVRRYLEPRINGGRYDAEDGIYRGPYQSVLVVHPVGGESATPLEVQGTPVGFLGLSDVEGQEADGVLAIAMADRWRQLADLRALEAGSPAPVRGTEETSFWRGILPGMDSTTDDRLRLSSLKADAESGAAAFPAKPWAKGPLGVDTLVRIAKDPTRGNVLVVEERGDFRSGGLMLPVAENGPINVEGTPTFAFWMKSESHDPIVLQFSSDPSGQGSYVARIGVDVPFAYDGVWHRVRIDLRPVGKSVEGVSIAPDIHSRAAIRETIGPIVASFSDLEATNEPADAKPVPETPSSSSTDSVVRARWAASAGQGEARRALLNDPIEAVKANAAAAALSRPDPADEEALIADSLYTFEPSLFTPALRALANSKTPTARESIRRAVRIAAADRARGLAAEILAESGDERLVAEFVGLNQARSSAARMSAIRALGRLPGNEAVLMRMSYLPQNDPAVKLAATRTADPDDDYQGRKLLWSAVNEPSDAVRLESLSRLSYSTIPEFQAEGLKGVGDDSVGVRVGLLQAWSAKPNPAALPAIRKALVDSSTRVRDAAVDALSAQPGAVETVDVPFNDLDPRVQLSVLRLSAAKKLTVPAKALERMRQSPDARVRAAAKPSSGSP